MGYREAILARPSPAYIDAKVVPESVVSPLVTRKQSFRGFSATSLSSLALGRNSDGSKRNSTGALAKKGVNFLMSGFRDSDSSLSDSTSSRSPSLMTDDDSLATTASSRSPSPEPSRPMSRLEAAFQEYTTTHSELLLQNVLLPMLVQTGPDSSQAKPSLERPRMTMNRKTSLNSACPAASSTENGLLEESDIGILFKWWNHLLLLVTPSHDIFNAVHAIAQHPSLRSTIFWDAHYELTLSTTLALPSQILPSRIFGMLIALGQVYHQPTARILRNLFTDPTRVSSAEPWIKRAKHVEALVEIIKSIYCIPCAVDEGGIMEARLEEMLSKVINVTSYPNPRLISVKRLIGHTDGVFAVKVEDCLMRISSKIGAFEFVSIFYLLDVMTSTTLTRIDHWTDVMDCIIKSENHVLQIRVFSFLYHSWETFSASRPTIDMLISPTMWAYFFSHWSGIVRDHYMRLIAYKLCPLYALEVKALLIRSFQTSILEHCQLRDCLPSNPIPNKRFAIRPITVSSPTYRPNIRGSRVIEPITDKQQVSESPSCSPDPPTNVVKKRLGFFRGLWAEEVKEDVHPSRAMAHDLTSVPTHTHSTTSTVSFQHGVSQTSPDESIASRDPFLPTFKFVPEYVGKQWSKTSDADGTDFLDSVMDAAKFGRLPLHAYPLPLESASQEDIVHPFPVGEGRKQLWTRSLSEWSILLDDADRFWRTPGSRVPSSGVRVLNCPLLEVEFPRWFVQRATQVPGDGGKEI